MPKTLDNWVLELRKQFEEETLKKHVARAKITIGLVDMTSGEIQYHSLEYTAKNLRGTPSKSKGGDENVPAGNEGRSNTKHLSYEESPRKTHDKDLG
jgi:hypothetical protein